MVEVDYIVFQLNPNNPLIGGNTASESNSRENITKGVTNAWKYIFDLFQGFDLHTNNNIIDVLKNQYNTHKEKSTKFIKNLQSNNSVQQEKQDKLINHLISLISSSNKTKIITDLFQKFKTQKNIDSNEELKELEELIKKKLQD